MLSFFMILMTVSSAPLDLVNKKQSSNYVTEIMSHPRFSEVLLQNETLLSELAEADPGTLETILGLLNGLLDDSEAASVAFTTDVTNALAARVAKQDEVVGCVLTHNGAVSAVDAANLTLIGAVSDERQAAGAVTDATSDYDAAARHHTAMVDELNENQPGMDAESETLRSTLALIRTLLPEADDVGSNSKTLSLLGGRTAYGGSYATPTYTVGNGICIVEGMVRGVKGDIAQLPTGCRPTKRLIFNLNNHDKTCRVDVLANGMITWMIGGGYSWLPLNGITFSVGGIQA